MNGYKLLRKMKIKILVRNRLIKLVTTTRIRNLLSVVPKTHITGLEEIIVTDGLKFNKQETVVGIYKQKNNIQPSTIEISFNTLYRGIPTGLLLFPFIAKFLLATVLYHEIGHHYHRKFTHGISKKSEESFANEFKKEMLKRKYWLWALLISPLAPLVKYLNKKVNG